LGVRQLSWLHSAPDKNYKPSPQHQPRIETENFESFFSSLEPESEYLVSLFQSSGMVQQTGYGPISLSWVEIKAWNETLNLNLTTRELLAIKKMSSAYANQQHFSKDPACIAPALEVDEDLLELKRNKIAAAFKNLPKKMRRK
jgi:hypothetical protein